MKVCVATNNFHKLQEIQQAIGSRITLLTLREIGCYDELPETSDTLEGNAIQKAQFVAQRYQIPCFADDTGLEVEALNGAPGVHTAYYAGKERDALKNNLLLLKNLEGYSNRNAQFRTVIAWVWHNEISLFEGVVRGKIATQLDSGTQGFGYDPLFIPEGFDIPFSQMDIATKNAISHRGKALKKLIEFLNQRL
ncbi:MAG: RdgB/HAM1 family non-canonical purine NTP pyrophosphatase [Cytophagales bacterium]|nr:RdgB/HAM1 family non-canonical purine NTP pyrophosphatase [Cytophagales bacterium]MDW8384659.1 RdgB/HAM1 family non-canonical purine NTP pyrophosphatase [Flammeovirgaceae bacterium]